MITIHTWIRTGTENTILATTLKQKVNELPWRARETELQHNGGVQVRRTGDNGITSSRAKQRKDTSRDEGKHRICNTTSKSVLTNGKNHSDRPWKSLVQTWTDSTNPHRFTQTPIDSRSPCQTLKQHIQHLKWAKTPLMQELILILN